MPIIYTPTKSKKKPNKKPGWKKEEAEYAAWKAKHAPNPALQKELRQAGKILQPEKRIVRTTERLPSRVTPTVLQDKIHDPRVKYKDNPEMLERELAAKERKFTTAPIYNKGGAQLMTDEMLEELKAGSLRRR